MISREQSFISQQHVSQTLTMVTANNGVPTFPLATKALSDEPMGTPYVICQSNIPNMVFLFCCLRNRKMVSKVKIILLWKQRIQNNLNIKITDQYEEVETLKVDTTKQKEFFVVKLNTTGEVQYTISFFQPYDLGEKVSVGKEMMFFIMIIMTIKTQDPVLLKAVDHDMKTRTFSIKKTVTLY